MEKVNQFGSVFKELNKTQDENDLIINDLSESDEENQNISYNTGETLNLSLSCSFSNSSKRISKTKLDRSLIAKRKARRFSPLQCIDSQRKLRHNQASSCHQNSTNSQFQKHKNNEEEDIFSSQEIQIDWESSGDTDTNNKNFEDLSIIANTATASQVSIKTGCKDINEYAKNLFRRCRKGSYVHRLKQAIRKAKTDQRYLEHDQKYIIRPFHTLMVTNIKESFGVYIATCQNTYNGNEIETILYKNMGKHTQIGDLLEAFFTEPFEAYKIDENSLPIIVQPKQILKKS